MSEGREEQDPVGDALRGLSEGSGADPAPGASDAPAEPTQCLCGVCGGPNRRSLKAKYCSTKCSTRAGSPSKAQALTRNARLAGAVIVEEVDPAVVFERDCGVCYLCGKPASQGPSGTWDATVDHVHPSARGGDHSYANVRLAHRRCNARKGNAVIVLSETPFADWGPRGEMLKRLEVLHSERT